MLPVFSLLIGWLSSEGTETTYVTKASQFKYTEEAVISIKIKQLFLHQVCFISSTGILLNKAPFIYCQATAKEDSLQNQISCGCSVYK